MFAAFSDWDKHIRMVEILELGAAQEIKGFSLGPWQVAKLDNPGATVPEVITAPLTGH